MKKLIATIIVLSLLLGSAFADLGDLVGILATTPKINPMHKLIDGCTSAVTASVEELEFIGFDKNIYNHKQEEYYIFPREPILGLKVKEIDAYPHEYQNEIMIRFEFRNKDEAYYNLWNLESIIYQEYRCNPGSVIVDGKYTSYSNAQTFIGLQIVFDEISIWFEIGDSVFCLRQNDSEVDLIFGSSDI